MTEPIDMLVQTDQEVFLWLNSQHVAWLDTIMYWITYKYTWIPMYIILIVFSFRNGRKRGGIILLVVLVAVALDDQVTSGLMKPYFLRLRPCHEPALKDAVHLVTGCGGMFGFASSHASTSFAVAMSWYGLLKSDIKYIGFLFLWAAVYSYSRVYVGVHYPADILVGAAVGLLIGYGCVAVYNTFLKKYYLH